MRRFNARGQAAVEFAAILPILFIIFYVVLEFSFLFIQQQRVSSLCRETAGAAFRDCSVKSDTTTMNECLDGVVNQVNALADRVLKDFGREGKVIASAYVPDPVFLNDPRPVMLLSRRDAGGGGGDSRYSAARLDPGFVQDQGVVIIGEVFYPYSPITPIKGILQLLRLPTELYENVIY